MKKLLLLPLFIVSSMIGFSQYNMTDGSTINTCAGTFYDPQGASNYTDIDGTITQTFCSDNDGAIQFNFTAFETREAADILNIYDGPNTGSTLIGSYSVTTGPGTITSTGTCITFEWITDGNHDAKIGWVANISCSATPPGNHCNNTVILTPGTQQCGTNSYAGDFNDDGTAPINPCSSSYNDGEYWYEYTANGSILQLDVTGLSASYSGVFVLDNCPSSSPNCIASYSSSSTTSYSVTTPGLTNGQTYYIAIINYSTPYSTDFCLDATEINCLEPTTVTASASNSLPAPGENVTFSYDSHSGGVCLGNWEYEWRDDSGTVLQSWSTTSTYNENVGAIGNYTYYLFMRCSDCSSDVTQSNAVNFSVAICSNCSNAEAIGGIPYTYSGSTCNSCDNYSSSDACGSSYLNGDDFVFEYTPASNITVEVDLTSDATYDGVIVTEGCPDVGTCVSAITSSSSGASGQVSLIGGTTYYFTVSTEPSPQCINSFTLNINVPCDPPTGITITTTPSASSVVPGTSVVFDYAGHTDGLCSGTWEYEWRDNSGTVLQAWSSTTSYTEVLNNSVIYWLYMRCTDCPSQTFGQAISMFVADCEWKVCLEDEASGYEGGEIEVIVDGVSQGVTTLASGVGPECYSIYIIEGSDITIDYTSSSYSSENEYYLYDMDNNLIHSEGESSVTPSDYTYNNAYCGGVPECATSAINDTLCDGLLEWIGPTTGLYPDGFTLYFGTNNPPTNIINGLDVADTLQWDVGALTLGQTYYWQIVPYDDSYGNAVGCSVWSFYYQTAPAAPVITAYPPAIMPGDSALLSSPSDVYWFNKCKEDVITYDNAFYTTPPYSVTYYAAAYNGCYSDCDTLYVQVIQPCDAVAFANGDIDTLRICAGDTVDLSASAGCDYMMNNDFNDGSIGVGWNSNCSPMFDNPCITPTDGSTYLWIGNASTFPRDLTTQEYIVTDQCQICFDFVLATQGDASPCEGPDEIDEGVSLQWATDGSTWTDITYFSPDGCQYPSNIWVGDGTTVDESCSSDFVDWGHYCFTVPALAVSSQTQFRFHQEQVTSSDNDHWGIDNVEIACPGNGLIVQWSHGSTELDPTADVYPTTSTEYTVIVDDGFNMGNADTSSVYVEVMGTPIVTDAQICGAGGSVTLVASGGPDYNWYDNSTGGSLVGTGANLTINPLNVDETYWVEYNVPSFGPINYTFEGSLDGWTTSDPCGLEATTGNWVTHDDSGVQGIFAEDFTSNSSQMIQSPVIDVSSFTGTISFFFNHRYNVDSWDHGYVAYRLDGGTWTQLPITTGSYNSSGTIYNDPLGACVATSTLDSYTSTSAYAVDGGVVDVTVANTVEFGFIFTTDGSSGYEGWYIDEATISSSGLGSCPNSRAEANATVGDINADFTSTDVSCYNSLDGDATAVATDGGGIPIPGIYTYTWSGGETTQTISNQPAGTYDVTITDDYGCTATTTATVNSNMPIDILTVSGNSGTCNIQSPNNWVLITDNTDNDKVIAGVFDYAGGNNLFDTEAEATIFPTVQTFGGEPYLQRVVRITPVSNGAADVRIYFTDAEFAALQVADPSIISIADLGVTKCDDAGSWTNCGVIPASFATTGDFGGVNYAEVSVTSFSKFYIHKYTSYPLPVELSSFTTYCKNGLNVLNWTTESETNNDYFVLEKSEEGEYFTTLAIIEGNHNTNEKVYYSYIDDNKNNEVNYYRLKQVDINGDYTYSNIITSNCYSEVNVDLYPNPTVVGQNIHIDGDYNKIVIKNVLGQDINYQIIDNNIIGLPSGVYIVSIDNYYKTKLIVR